MCLYLIRHGPSPNASGLREKVWYQQLDMAEDAWLDALLGAVPGEDTCLPPVLLRRHTYLT